MLIPGQLVRWLLKRQDAPTVGVYAVVEAVAADAVTVRLDTGDCYTVPPKQLFVLPEEITMKMSQLFPSKYVKAADLNGKTVTLTIDKLVIEELGHGSEKERKPVLYFQKATKGLVLNRTNAMTIAGLYGDESDEWPGKRISIYPTRIRAFGAMQDTIRIREEIPAQPKPQGQTAQVEEVSEIDDVEDVTDPEEPTAMPQTAPQAAHSPAVMDEAHTAENNAQDAATPATQAPNHNGDMLFDPAADGSPPHQRLFGIGLSVFGPAWNNGGRKWFLRFWSKHATADNIRESLTDFNDAEKDLMADYLTENRTKLQKFWHEYEASKANSDGVGK